MLFSTLERVESILQTIDRLGIVKIKHLQEIHDLKSYRNACRIITTQLRPFIIETYFQKEKVMFLNKKGRDMIGSEKEETKITQKTIHSLLRNEVYIYFNCPFDWENEKPIETVITPSFSSEILFKGVTLGEKKKVVPDAVFTRNGYKNFIEIDNTQDMRVNSKKIESYREIFPKIKEYTPFLYFFTSTDGRKKKLKEWLKGLHHEVYTFDEIK